MKNSNYTVSRSLSIVIVGTGAILSSLSSPLPASAAQGRILVGTDQGIFAHMKAFASPAQTEVASLFPYPARFEGGVRVAVGDLNGDGAPDFVTGSGPGAAHVRAFSGRDQSELHSFLPYGANFLGGVYVASGDVNGDGIDDIVTGADSGASPHVKVFDGKTGADLASFFAYPPTFSGGVRVATGDVDGDGLADIITGSGAGAGHVKVFSGKSHEEIRSYLAYGGAFSGGIFVASGDINGDGLADVVTGADAGAGPHVKVFDSRSQGESIRSFFPYPAGFAGGVRVATGDLDGDGRHELIVSPGKGGAPLVRVFDSSTLNETASFLAYVVTQTDGVFIAAGSLRRPTLENRLDPRTREIILRWPSGCGCALETSRDLMDARGWKPLETRAVELDNRLEARLSSSLEAQFFRLVCPE